MNADAALLAALAAVHTALTESGRPSMIIGGIAVIARGVPRQTIDIDATVAGDNVDPAALVETLSHHSIVPRIPNAVAFARERQVLLLRHEPTGTPLELSLAWLPFEHDAIARATIVDFAGIPIRVATAEDLIIFKTIAWRDRDRGDIERLLQLHAGQVDFGRVRGLVREFSDALDEPERPREFEALVRRALEGREA